jgi:uncharacterized protein (DUF1015 family)
MARSSSVISPFHGIRYRTAESRDLSSRMAPPYDIIDASLQDDLYAQHEHNFVRVELPRPPEPETEERSRYTQAAATLESWLAGGVMVREERPAFYTLEQEFTAYGERWRRRGVFAALRLPEEDERYVLSHEGTMAGPKADRLKLMQACATMTSPIMVMSEDTGSKLLSRLQQTQREPDATATDREGVAHRLWVVDADEEVDAIRSAVGAGPLYIADGHHRFETAITCRNGMREAYPSAPADAGFNYALAFVTSARDEALKILPTHRLISGLGARGTAAMKRRISEWCEVKQVSAAECRGERIQRLLSSGSRGGHTFLVCGGDGARSLLTVRQEKLRPSASAVASLDVSILHEYLIDPVLAEVGEAATLSFVHDEETVVRAAERGECDFAFLLRPAGVQDVLRAAGAGERMPQKSTFFFPKAPAGLVVSSLGRERV